MDFADGGKIDTELYSAAWAALNSVAGAADGPASRTKPAKHAASPKNAEVLPAPAHRLRLPFDFIRSPFKSNLSENYRSGWTIPRPAA